MITIGEILLLLAAIVCAMVAFHLLDKWHQRRAWRRANEYARRYLEDLEERR